MLGPVIAYPAEHMISKIVPSTDSLIEVIEFTISHAGHEETEIKQSTKLKSKLFYTDLKNVQGVPKIVILLQGLEVQRE